MALLLGACGADGPELGPPERFQDDPVVGGLITRRLAEARAAADDPAGWLGLGMAFEANDFLTEAVAVYEHARELGGGARVRYRLGVAHASRGDADAAVEHLTDAAELAPAYAPAHWRLGYAHLRRGETDAAGRRFRHALEIDGAQIPARLGLARVHLQDGDPAAAAELLERVVRDAPGMPGAPYLLGLAYRRLGRSEEARPYLAAGGEAPEGRGGGGIDRTWSDPWQADMEASRVSHRMLLRLAEEAFEAGDLERAVATLETLRGKRPTDATVALNLATVYRRAGRAADALQLLEAALEHHPERFQVLLDLAATAREAGDPDRALAYAERAAEIDPRSAEPLELRAALLTARGELAAAAESRRRAAALRQPE